jgi:hypothetical protein
MAIALTGGADGARAQMALDYDLPVAGGARFFTQTDGAGGATGTGYAVSNADGIPFYAFFLAAGGVEALGYPVSHRFIWNGFVVQAFQKVILQWRPEVGTFYNVNVIDEMSLRGLDAWLLAVRQTPPPADWSGDAGLPFEAVAARHLALLAANPAIAAAYFAELDPINRNGLPMAAIQDMGGVEVLRAQRKIYQRWLRDVPWARAGQVVEANGGDLGKEAGLYPPEAIVPRPAASVPLSAVGTVAPPTAPPPPAPPPAPAPPPPPPAPAFPYAQQGAVTWEPNCGLTLIKGRIFNRDGGPQGGVTVRVWAAGWDGALSFPSRDDGYWDVLLDIQPKAGQWNVAVVDRNTGQPLSPTVVVETGTGDCGPGGGGRQVATVNFRQQ